MKVRIDTHFMDFEAGCWREPGQVVDVRDMLGDDWISKGWGIELKDAPVKEEVQTPEDDIESSKRETATVRRKAQHE